MIQLVDKKLSKASKSQLDHLQNEVNTVGDFVKQAEKAKRLWNAKMGSAVNKACFSEVKEVLLEMCVSVEVCNYCEQNEANDIEHIHPKSFYPSLAFEWDNYLLACKQCNSGYKLDKCYVMKADLSYGIIPRGTQPEKDSTVAFINPRIEDPNKYMLLDLGGNNIKASWEFMLRPNLSESEKIKANKTLEILRLNTRAGLKQGRKASSDYYYDRIKGIIDIINAKSIKELIDAVYPRYKKAIKKNISLDENKKRLTNSYKRDIQTHRHPSVWHAIKVIQSKVDDSWKELFRLLPEAKEW